VGGAFAARAVREGGPLPKGAQNRLSCGLNSD